MFPDLLTYRTSPREPPLCAGWYFIFFKLLLHVQSAGMPDFLKDGEPEMPKFKSLKSRPKH